jgi:hypothetical protein
MERTTQCPVPEIAGRLLRSKWAAGKAVRAGLAVEGAYLNPYVSDEQRALTLRRLLVESATMAAGFVSLPHDGVGIDAVECGISAVVDHGSSKRQRKAVEVTFRYFCREFRNQIVPYDSKALSGPDEYRAYLWVDRHEYVWHHHKKLYPVIGACYFHLREYKGALPPGVPGSCYVLEWTWFHPYERRRGHFSKALPYFLARFQRLIADDPGGLEIDALLI